MTLLPQRSGRQVYNIVVDEDDSGGFEAGWHMTRLQLGVEDVCEHQRQLINAVFQG